MSKNISSNYISHAGASFVLFPFLSYRYIYNTSCCATVRAVAKQKLICVADCPEWFVCTRSAIYRYIYKLYFVSCCFFSISQCYCFCHFSSLEYSPLPLVLFFMTVSPFFVGIINSQTTETLFSPFGTSVPPSNTYFAVAVCLL